jgi:hypothetical protein
MRKYNVAQSPRQGFLNWWFCSLSNSIPRIPLPAGKRLGVPPRFRGGEPCQYRRLQVSKMTNPFSIIFHFMGASPHIRKGGLL